MVLNMESKFSLTPLLIVRNAACAIDYYIRALGAKEIVRYLNKRQGTVSHADLAVGDSLISVTEEAHDWNSDAPPSLGGTPVVLQLEVEDVQALVGKMCEAGASVVFPLQEFCGERMARLRDPFGHLWILRQRIEELSPEEKQSRLDTIFAQIAAMTGSPVAVPGKAKNE
jgi:PhnB protein